MLKKAIIISFILLFSNTYAYSDVEKEHWAHNYIEELSNKTFLSGYPDGSFKPDDNIRRSEFISILAKVILPNADVSRGGEHWSEGAKNILIEKNILKLDEYSNFDPEKEITRLEVVKLITRGLTGFSEDILNGLSEVSQFIDINKYSTEERRMINILYKLNILSGYPDGMLRLEDVLTRAEATSLVSKFIKNKDKFLPLFDDKNVIYEDDIAIAFLDNLPYELKVKRNSNDLNYVTTKVNSIDIFEFGRSVPEKYNKVFGELYSAEDLYSKYRVKFGEGNVVLAVNITTTNNTDKYEIYAGHEFLNIEFLNEDITIIDSFDTDEIKRQKNNIGSVGEKIMPGKTLDTSAFYIITGFPKDKIRINRDITGLYDIEARKMVKESSFNSLIIKLREENK